MDKNVQEELIIAVASKVHEDWCMQELVAYFKRAQEIIATLGEKEVVVEENNEKVNADKELERRSFISFLKRKKETMIKPVEEKQKVVVYNPVLEALEQACFKNGVKRNELVLDTSYLVAHNTKAMLCLNSFDDFLDLFKAGAINVKRFVKRTLTGEEMAKEDNRGIDTDYKKDTGEENILRAFINLSADSKRENLEAALGAVNVYTEWCRAGISIEQMKSDEGIRDLIGVAIHTDWLKRNMEHSNDSLKVPYRDLDEWTKQQDLTVFDAVIDIILKARDKYFVKQVDGYLIPDYVEMECELLDNKTRKL